MSLPKAAAGKLGSAIAQNTGLSASEVLEALACSRCCYFLNESNKNVGFFQIVVKLGKKWDNTFVLEVLILGSGTHHSIGMQRINAVALYVNIFRAGFTVQTSLLLKNDFNTGNPVWVPLGG